jgi:hypothetical protein
MMPRLLLCLLLCSAADAKITLAGALGVGASITTIAINGRTIIETIRHPQRVPGKIKAAVTGKPQPPLPVKSKRCFAPDGTPVRCKP